MEVVWMTEAVAIAVDPTNADQARAWDGDQGDYWTDHAQHFDRAVADHHSRFMAAANIGEKQMVLDIGCGTGQTTCDAARSASSGFALGVDLSQRMLNRARQVAAAANLRNVRFEAADAQIHIFPEGSFDAAISRTGTMFFGDPTAAFANIASALRPGSHLTMLTWQPPEQNEWFRELGAALSGGRERPAPPVNAPGPFALSNPDRVRSVLVSAGFADPALEALAERMWFGTDPDDAYRFVLGLMGWMLDGLDAAGRERALEALKATLSAHADTNGVTFDSGTWLIRAVRR
jgi:ubiquinone/menaquinone biosynthesis C-methylase UbiE